MNDATDPNWIEACPYCGSLCYCDVVDVGVGYVQCGPFHCTRCFASEIGPNDSQRELSDDERRTGWYSPGSEPGSSANVIDGKVVSHVEMLAAYKSEFSSNPNYFKQNAVSDWFAETRRKK